MKHSEYVEVIKNTAINLGKKTLMKALLTKVPFLFYGPFGVITELLIEKALVILIRETEFAVFFKYIDMRVDQQGKDFTEAALNNYRIQQNGTPEEKKKSEEELISKFKSFVKLTS